MALGAASRGPGFVCVGAGGNLSGLSSRKVGPHRGPVIRIIIGPLCEFTSLAREVGPPCKFKTRFLLANCVQISLWTYIEPVEMRGQRGVIFFLGKER